jgi:hypothetical protein
MATPLLAPGSAKTNAIATDNPKSVPRNKPIGSCVRISRSQAKWINMIYFIILIHKSQ